MSLIRKHGAVLQAWACYMYDHNGISTVVRKEKKNKIISGFRKEIITDPNPDHNHHNKMS